MRDIYNNESCDDDVYVKTGDAIMPGDEISNRKFNMIIGLTLMWGFIVNILMIKYMDPMVIYSMNPIMFYVLYFGSCILGSIICNKSKNPVISFIGYNMVVIPFGAILNMAVATVAPGVVMNAIIITGVVTLIMMTLGVIFPNFYLKLGRTLFVTLFITLIVEVISFFITKSSSYIFDGIFIILFCGYIGYDWARASRASKTVDNAVDAAAMIYVDIINLFIRILDILSRRK